MRTIVKDSLDFPNAGIPTENHVYLDSDGQVNNILDGPKNKVSPFSFVDMLEVKPLRHSQVTRKLA